MVVKYLDLKKQYESIKDEIDKSISNVIDDTAFSYGKYAKEFENNFKSFLDTKYVFGTSSGTSALHLALIAMGIGPGDEVITVPNSFIATAEAISHAGATPVFVDVNPKTYLMDTAKLVNTISSKTKAIIPVHLFGQPADMDQIMEIASEYNLMVLEDACQAHGAIYNGKRAGSIGNAAAFSFYPGKNLGAYGEGGACSTNDPEIAKQIELYRAHGEIKRYYHEVIGYNYRLDGIQGAILNVKLKHLDNWNEKRRNIASMYNEMLSGVGDIITPYEAENRNSIYHIYAIRTKSRDALRDFLTQNEIQSGIHYPIPIHLQNAYKYLGYKKGDFPIAEEQAETTLSLPIYAEMPESDVIRVVDTIKKFFDKEVVK
ncbi:erythromycin biosynthesis sensory transduction protein eryC1 [candidate division TA06 bacterium]|uniref:Erythromycin biosynthesis sensory transduction protein eryC1 n=1 Tax=candidate division TA06 bacterium TaxID=2250710 RepID=A0A660SDI5_UNCT6|nr:MAG: erythromycin biosynthesis sensory transduction protein eryC1 [candidate division TA06 bacterium]